MLYCAFRYGAADHELQLARRSIEARDLPGAAMHYGEFERWKLPGASADLWYSRALLSIGAILPAGQAALAATRTAEEPFNAWYNLAELYAAGNSGAETESSLRRAAAAKPNWFKPHWMLARLLRIESRVAEAAAEAATAADLDGGKHPEVTRTAAELQAARR